jgi:GAF domain-containing protein
LLSQTFVELADTLVDDFDVVDLLTTLADRCISVLDAGAAGVLLADQHGNLQVMAASSEEAHLLELFQLQNQEGPCLDCYGSGRAVTNVDLAGTDRWPRFGPEARANGFVCVQALPLRLRADVIGALNVFMDDRVVLDDSELAVAQALADAATIAIIQAEAARQAQLIATQLRQALDSRIAIEQAKGMLAERFQIDMGEAFGRLRGFARDHNRGLTAVAADLVAGTLAFEAFTRRGREVGSN